MASIQTNTDTTTGTIVDKDGNVLNKPTVILSKEEAELLRNYKKFLQKRGLREMTFCNTCWSGDREDGMDVFVTDAQILFKCRHRLLFYQGSTY